MSASCWANCTPRFAKPCVMYPTSPACAKGTASHSRGWKKRPELLAAKARPAHRRIRAARVETGNTRGYTLSDQPNHTGMGPPFRGGPLAKPTPHYPEKLRERGLCDAFWLAPHTLPPRPSPHRLTQATVGVDTDTAPRCGRVYGPNRTKRPQTTWIFSFGKSLGLTRRKHLFLARSQGRWPLVRMTSSGTIGRTGILIWAILVFPTVVFATNGIEPIDTSLQARIRGGVDVPIGDSALSQINNPASLAQYRQRRFDFSGQVCFPSAHWYGPLGHSESTVHIVPLGNAAVALPIDERWAFGVALHSKAGLASQYRMRHLLIPIMKRRVAADSKMVGLHFNLGCKLTDRLFVGAGVRGEVATSSFSMALGPADAEFERGYAYGGGFQVGMMYRATQDLTLGVAYRSPSWFGDLAGGDARASLLGVLPVDLGPARIESVQLAQKVTAGAAWGRDRPAETVG